MKAVFKGAWPYQDDEMNLPVLSVDQAIPFYETVIVAPDGLCYCLGERQP